MLIEANQRHDEFFYDSQKTITIINNYNNNKNFTINKDKKQQQQILKYYKKKERKEQLTAFDIEKKPKKNCLANRRHLFTFFATIANDYRVSGIVVAASNQNSFMKL